MGLVGMMYWSSMGRYVRDIKVVDCSRVSQIVD